MISVGGAEDRSQLVLWNLKEGRSECAQPVSEPGNFEITDVKFYNRDPCKFVTGTNTGLKLQMLDVQAGKF